MVADPSAWSKKEPLSSQNNLDPRDPVL
jgi:hypothetical protein